MTKKDDLVSTVLELPAELREVALVDADTAAAVGGMSPDWWRKRVRRKEAPRPVVSTNRLARWALSDVRKFWLEFIEQGDSEASAARAISRAKKASAAARALLIGGAR